MTIGPSDLFDACETLLQAATSALGSLAPERRYVATSLPALDCCDQLNVHAQAVNATEWESPGGGNGPLGSVRKAETLGPALLVAELVVTAAWEVTTPDSPEITIPPSVLQAEAQQVLYAGWALYNGLRYAFTDGLIFPRGEAEMSGLSPIQQQGAMSGWTVTFRVRLDGYSVVWPT